MSHQYEPDTTLACRKCGAPPEAECHRSSTVADKEPQHEPSDWCPPRAEDGEGSWPLLMAGLPAHAGNLVVADVVREELVRMLSHLPDQADVMVTFAIDRKGGGVYSYGWTQDRSVRLNNPTNEFLGRVEALADHLDMRLLDAQLETPEGES